MYSFKVAPQNHLYLRYAFSNDLAPLVAGYFHEQTTLIYQHSQIMDTLDSESSPSFVHMKDEEIKDGNTAGLHRSSDDADDANDASQNELAQNSSVEPEKKSFKFKVTVFMICLTSVIVSMDSVIVASALPAITVALKRSSLEAFWVGTSYLLAQTVSFCPQSFVE